MLVPKSNIKSIKLTVKVYLVLNIIVNKLTLMYKKLTKVKENSGSLRTRLDGRRILRMEYCIKKTVNVIDEISLDAMLSNALKLPISLDAQKCHPTTYLNNHRYVFATKRRKIYQLK